MTYRSVLDGAMVQSLRQRFGGTVVAPEDAGYDEARKIWNARIDRRPAAVARCADATDVSAAVRFARENDLLVSVRGGGHDFAGNSICDGGLVIDLSSMRAVRIDAEARTARVQPGVRWGDFDRAAQAFGLATTGGSVSTVGVAGYTLGGGTGYLVRKHGLAADNLVAAEMVDANGELVRAGERENDDLLWGLRGGSGNLGIVTSFEFRLHRVGPQVLAGQIIHELAAAKEALRFYRSFMAEAPDEVQCYPFFIRIPPLPAFPEPLHGRVVLDLVVAYAGDLDEGERVLRPIRQFGRPALDGVATVAYVDLQQAFDAGMAPGNRWYSKAHQLKELPDEAIDRIVAGVEQLPGAFSMVYLEPGGGAVARVEPSATAYPHRHAPFSLHIFPGWTDAGEDGRIIEWARRFHGEMAPYSTGGTYVNQLDGDEVEVARVAYGSNRDRLAGLKWKYDPQNVFRMNHNVAPAR